MAQQQTTLSRRGYGLLKSELPDAGEALKAQLTLEPNDGAEGFLGEPGGGGKLRLYLESPSKLYVPRAFGLATFGPPTRPSPAGFAGEPLSAAGARFAGALRPMQRAAVDAFLATRDRGGILSIPCGGGKTVIALAIVAALGVRTIIVLHKDFLIAQWRERIAAFLPGASVGLIKAAKVDVAGKDIVLASLQSLALKPYDERAVLGGFGLLVVDEVHRTGTEVFINALKKTCASWTLGLSATVDRKDGMERAFKWYLGDVAHRISRRELDGAAAADARPRRHAAKGVVAAAAGAVVANMVRYRPPADDPSADVTYSAVETIASLGKANVSRMINNVCAYAPRTAFAASLIATCVRAAGRRVLVLCDRKQLLRDVADELRRLRSDGAADGISTGFYIGGMKEAELKASEGADVILATFSFAAEGFDVPGLDTLFLLSPKTDVEQAVGRILRQRPDERRNVPHVYDLVDGFSVFSGQARKRATFYAAQGYDVRWVGMERAQQQAASARVPEPRGSSDDDGDDASVLAALHGAGCLL